MRAAIIENSTVVNLILVDSMDSPVLAGFIAVGLPEDSPIYNGWSYDGTEFIAPPVPTPEPVVPPVPTLTPRQIRLQLSVIGLRIAVETAVAASTQDIKDMWEFSLEYRKDDPILLAMAAQIGATSEQMDTLFTEGKKL